MTVSVLVPYRGGCEQREKAWLHVAGRYTAAFPHWRLVTGTCAPGPFNRAEAIIDAARGCTSDVLVVADADVWCDGIADAVEAVEEGAPWAVPHRLIHRLSFASTIDVLTGSDWQGLPLSLDNAQDRRPYPGNEAGTLLVLSRQTFEQVPPDRRFVGWGQEDVAWALALRVLVGPPVRFDHDLVHLWHPPQERKNRVVGNDVSLALLRRYRRADRTAMQALVDESRPLEVTR